MQTTEKYWKQKISYGRRVMGKHGMQLLMEYMNCKTLLHFVANNTHHFGNKEEM
jgi:hypothetical protein